MKQDKIWNHFQNEGLATCHFRKERPRFVLKYLKPGQKVLNIGVGAGDLERLSVRKGILIHTLDPNEQAIERLRAELDSGKNVKTGRIESIPFEDNFFDVVVLCEVIEHLDDITLKQGLSETRRVTKPGGFLLVTTPYKENLGGANIAVCPDCGKAFNRIGHVQSFDFRNMTDTVQEAGFDIKNYICQRLSTGADPAWQISLNHLFVLC